MTCKDCMGHDFCSEMPRTQKNVEKQCDRFKNKADYAEVVRCGECERRSKGADLTNTIYCPLLKQIMDKTEFCSYGIKK